MTRHIIDKRTDAATPEDTARFGELEAQEEGRAHPSTIAANRAPREKDSSRLKEFVRIERGHSA